MRTHSTWMAVLAATLLACGDDDEQFEHKSGLPFAEPAEVRSDGGVTAVALLSKEAKVCCLDASTVVCHGLLFL